MSRAGVGPSARVWPLGFLQLLLPLLLAVGAAAQQDPYFIPADNILMNCGTSGRANDADGRTWIGDANSKFAPPQNSGSSGAALQAETDDPALPSEVPYHTARVFTAPATYSFAVSSGRHWLRLHFYPSNYGTRFKQSDALFNVTANGFELLGNFSSSQTAQALNLVYIVREFAVSVAGKHLNVTFTPEKASASAIAEPYAFVNGIEVMSMPELFNVTANLVGTQGQISVTDQWSLLTVFRLNVGGTSIPAPRDSNQSRTWYTDVPFIYGAGYGVSLDNSSSPVQYSASVPAYVAPAEVYTTFRQMSPDSELNVNTNLSWAVPIDSNFTYLVRMHFCEWVYSKSNQRVFNIYLNNQTAEESFDVIGLVGSPGVPVYRDYAVYVGESSGPYLFVELQPDQSTRPQYNQALLNGLEIFKVNDSSGSLAGSNPVPAPSVNYAGPGSPPSTKTSHNSSKAPVIGGVAGGAALLFLLLGGVCLLRCRRAPSGGDRQSTWFIPIYGNSHTIASKVSTTSGKSGTGSYVSSAPSSFCRHFSFAEIQEATNNFDESKLLGVGGFGKVYQGEIDGGIKVAVKRGNPLAEQGVHEFQTEIEMLSKLRHRHLVSLIGYCEENCEMILVYDCMAKGPLRGHLYGNPNLTPLTWKQRLEICIGAARGLHYLHTGAAQTIIHRDVKTTNILLDENLVAKVSDFGLSKTGPTLDHTHVSTVVKGSFGYLDPEYYRRQQLTEKSDVYSFGVVLFEVVCARPAINPSLPREQVSIAEWALHHQRRGFLEQIIDPYLKDKINPESLKKYGEAAEKCLAEQGIDRPSMGDVLWNLEFALQLQENAIQHKLVDDSTNAFVEMSPMATDPNNIATYATKTQNSVTSIGTQSLVSEDLDDVTPSAVFSQLVNPQGR